MPKTAKSSTKPKRPLTVRQEGTARTFRSATNNTRARIAFVSLLFALAFLLTFHSNLRMARLWLSHDVFERHRLNFSLEGVPAEWGYAAWLGPPQEIPAGSRFPWEQPASETPRNIPPLLNHNIGGGPLVINGVTFQSGVGTHAPGKIAFSLDGKFSRFSCGVGLDATSVLSRGVIYTVIADGREILRSPKLNSDADPYPVDVEVGGVHELVLNAVQTDFADTRSNVDWVNLKFEK